VRIPPWTPEAASRDPALLDAILKRRGGKLINLDLALLWSEPLARGWNAYVGAVRRELSVSPQLKELAICHGSDVWGDRLGPRWHLESRLMRRRDVRVIAASSFTAGSLIPGCRAAVLPPGLSRAWFGELASAAAAAPARRPGGVEVMTAFRLGDWRDKGLVELTAAIATYNMVARLLLPLDIEPDAK